MLMAADATAPPLPGGGGGGVRLRPRALRPRQYAISVAATGRGKSAALADATPLAGGGGGVRLRALAPPPCQEASWSSTPLPPSPWCPSQASALPVRRPQTRKANRRAAPPLPRRAGSCSSSQELSRASCLVASGCPRGLFEGCDEASASAEIGACPVGGAGGKAANAAAGGARPKGIGACSEPCPHWPPAIGGGGGGGART
mmetsp:Transcript_8591/g.22190  ORF Transcript_8591/g.22190 Transcript_8591/m.22190 type:complete len:202 (-) Transcript_8591:1359-1964(-)